MVKSPAPSRNQTVKGHSCRMVPGRRPGWTGLSRFVLGLLARRPKDKAAACSGRLTGASATVGCGAKQETARSSATRTGFDRLPSRAAFLLPGRPPRVFAPWSGGQVTATCRDMDSLKDRQSARRRRGCGADRALGDKSLVRGPAGTFPCRAWRARDPAGAATDTMPLHHWKLSRGKHV